MQKLQSLTILPLSLRLVIFICWMLDMVQPRADIALNIMFRARTATVLYYPKIEKVLCK